MGIKIFLNDKEIEIENKKIKVKDLLKSLNINPEEVIVIDKRKNKLLTHDVLLSEKEILEIRKVVSGG